MAEEVPSRFWIMFVLVATSQLMAVFVGLVTKNAIWFNPDPCPEKYMNLGLDEMRKVCELQYYSYNKWKWVLKSE